MHKQHDLQMAAPIKREEQLNTWSHAMGAIGGLLGLVLLLRVPNSHPWYVFSMLLYGGSVMILFTASTLYHAAKSERLKHRFRILDHMSIYLLIAGTYTPVSLLLLEESRGWLLFYLVWGIAGFGLILKLFFTGRFEVFSTSLYLVMGWLIVLDYTALTQHMAKEGLQLMFLGGAFYTIGIVFYAIEKIPYNHFIWHLFVLGGAISHFFMVWYYVA